MDADKANAPLSSSLQRAGGFRAAPVPARSFAHVGKGTRRGVPPEAWPHAQHIGGSRSSRSGSAGKRGLAFDTLNSWSLLAVIRKDKKPRRTEELPHRPLCTIR
eukprot:gene14334-biopygen11321